MKIAIDCRTALSPKTGDRTYCLNLLRGLAALDLNPARWQFECLLDAPDETGILPACKYLQPVVLPAPNSRAWTLFELPRYVKKSRPDCVHLQYLAPRLACPFVTSIHDVVWRALPHTFPRLHRHVMNAFMPSTAKRAARIICGTQSAREDICKYLQIEPDKVRVTPYSIEPVYSQAISSNQIETVKQKYRISAPYVLSVGVQQPRKNVERLVRAWMQFKTKFPQSPHILVICGKDGWGDAPRVTSALSHLIFTGYVEDEELPALYAGADCFAYPSLYEGFGLPILEAMASGCAVLTSDCGAMREVAGGAAQSCDPQSVDSIAQALENVLMDNAWRENLRTMGRTRAEEFSVERHALETLEVYIAAAAG